MKEILNDALAYWDDRLTRDIIVPTGRNGPWNHQMTNVRITAHLISLYSNCETIGLGRSGVADELGCKLMNHHLYKDGYYISRTGNRDDANGLIGQAWVVEGLLSYSVHANSSEALERAVNILESHKFCWNNLGWMSMCSNHAFGAINQQIYFAAMVGLASQLMGKPIMRLELEAFLAGLDDKIQPNLLGIPRHVTGKGLSYFIKLHNLELSLGYYSFILLGLALIKKYTGVEIANFTTHRNSLVRSAISKSKFSDTYNLTDLEIAIYEKHVLGGDFKKYLKKFNNVKNKIESGVDIDTFWARTYEVFYV